MSVGTSGLAYRPAIDGLRAVAVLLVLFSHLEVPHMHGGFVGVDIFFVISGYLITGNIERHIATGNFSIPDFYERRFRRIVPALIVMLFVTSVLATLVFLPEELIGYSRSLLAAFFSYSNLHLYWTNAGYFGSSYTQILLHTWSLGVEEQFYLLMPLGMILAAQKPRLLRWMIIAIATISFLCATYSAFRDPILAFYMPYTRAWELLSGSLISLRMLPLPKSRMIQEAMVASSFILIVTCTIGYNSIIPFPGATALLPCAAAVLFILAGETGLTSLSAPLTWRPVVFIGLISYSLYLWHWPLIVLVRLGAVRGVKEGTQTGFLFISLMSLLLAFFSWRFVEQPFRTGPFRKLSQRRVFECAAACGGLVIVIAVFLQSGQGLPGRFPPMALEVSKYLRKHPQMRTGTCFVETGFSDFDRGLCLGQVNGKRNVLLFGDSHAAALWWGLQHEFPTVHFLQATMAACPPTEGSYRRSNCSRMRRFIYENYLSQNRVDAVVLTERWSSIKDLDDMESSLGWFQTRGIPVTVIGPVPEYTAPLPFLLAFGLKLHDPRLAERNKVGRLEQLNQQIHARLDGRPGVTYASVWDVLCSGESCAVYANEAGHVPMLADVDHLTNQGSVVVIDRLQNAGELDLR